MKSVYPISMSLLSMTSEPCDFFKIHSEATLEFSAGRLRAEEEKELFNKTFGRNAMIGPPRYLLYPDGFSTIVNVIFNDPATIVFWGDGTKTVVKTQNGEPYDPEKGLAMAIAKHYSGNNYSYYNQFKHWLKKYDSSKR